MEVTENRLQMRSMIEKIQLIPDLSNIYAVSYINHSIYTQISKPRDAVFPFTPFFNRKKYASLQNCGFETGIPCFFNFFVSLPKTRTGGCNKHCKSPLLSPQIILHTECLSLGAASI